MVYYFQNFTMKPFLSLDDRCNFALTLGKTENRNVTLSSIPGPTFHLEPFQVINMHINM